MHKSEFELESLEPRLLLSADPVAEFAASVLAPDTPVILETQADPEDELFGDLHDLPESAANSAETTSEASAIPPLAPVESVASAAGEADVAALTETLVTTLNAANPPPVFGGPRSGAVTSQGDVAMGTDQVRSTYSVTGAGVIIGVISDSYDALVAGAAANDVTAGELPTSYSVTGGTVLPASGPYLLVVDPGASGHDEGRAMLQIAHDVAPGAILVFHSVDSGLLAAVQALTAPIDSNGDGTPDFGRDVDGDGTLDRGVDILVDDVKDLSEGWFWDGQVAEAITTAKAAGIAYFNSAGNYGRNGYQADFHDSGATHNGGRLHDFDPGSGTSTTMRISPTSGRVTLQTPHSSGTNSVMTVYLLSSSTVSAGNVIATSTNASIGIGEIEIVNVPTADPLYVAVALDSGDAPQPFHLLITDGDEPYIDQFATNSPTNLGNHNSRDGVAIGAANYHQTPLGWPVDLDPVDSSYRHDATTEATLADYSSIAGHSVPGDVDFGAATHQVIVNPEVLDVDRWEFFMVGPDGGNVSDNFRDGSGVTQFGTLDIGDFDTNPNFKGTSSAAPHVAAAAALLLELNPSLSVDELSTVLARTSLDMDNPHTPGFDTGFDFATGFGFIQALEAANALATGAALDGVLTGRLFDDLNGDGTRDFGEPGVAGVSIQAADSSGTVVATETSDIDGYYFFSIDGVAGDTYSLTLVNPPGQQTSTSPSVTLNAGTVEIEQDIGVQVINDGETGVVGLRPAQTAGGTQLGTSIEGMRITASSTANPAAAVGPDHLLALTQDRVAWWPKAYETDADDLTNFRAPTVSYELTDFFDDTSARLATAAYDAFVGRFVLASVNSVGDIALMVSDDSNPNGTWYSGSIEVGDLSVEALDVAIADSVVYVSAEFDDFDDPGAKIWAVDVWTERDDAHTEVPTGFYHGGDVLTESEDVWGFSAPELPHVIPAGTKTGNSSYIVHYVGEEGGTSGHEVLTIWELSNPTNSFTIGSATQIPLGDIDDTSSDLPDAPQASAKGDVPLGERRASNAYFDGTYLYTAIVTTDGSESSVQVLRVKVSDSSVSIVEIDGEDIDSNIHTYNPAIAVNDDGDIGVVFNASGAGLDVGAYVATIENNGGTLSLLSTQPLAAGMGAADRSFAATHGIGVDPGGPNEASFWALGAYALPAGNSAIDGTSSQWGTRWGNFGKEAAAGTGISGIVYLDANDDDTHNSDEVGVARATVSLYEDDGDGAIDTEADSLVTVTQSDQFGYYGFFGLDATKTYFVAVDIGEDLSFTTSGSRSVDSDGLSALGDAATLDGLEAGIAVNTVSGFAFRDRDADGLWEEADEETGIAEVTVNLYLYDGSGDPNPEEDTFIASATTDADGEYLFFAQGQSGLDSPSTGITQLDDGDYVVEFVKPSNGKIGTADAGDDTIDSDATHEGDDSFWTDVFAIAGSAVTNIGAALENAISLESIVAGLKSALQTLDTTTEILNDVAAMPMNPLDLSEVISIAEFASDLGNRLESFASISTPTIGVFAPTNDFNFVTSIDGGEPFEIAISASDMADNTSLSDLIGDINAAISLAGLGSLIEASIDGDGFAISAIDDGSSGNLSLSLMRLAGTPSFSYGQPGLDLDFDVTVERPDGDGVAFDTIFEISLPESDTEDNASLGEFIADLNLAFQNAELGSIKAFENGGQLVFSATDPDVSAVSLSSDWTSLGFSSLDLVLDAGAAELGLLEGLRGVGGLKFNTLDELEAVLLEALIDLSDGALPEGFDLDFNFDSSSNELTFNLGLVKSYSQTTELDFGDGISLGALGTIEFVAAANASYSVDLSMNLQMGISLGDPATDLGLASGTDLVNLNDGAGIPILVGITASSASPTSLTGDFDFDITITGGDHAGTHTIEYVHDSLEVFFDAYDVAAAMNLAISETDLADAIEFFFDGTNINVWAIDSTIIQLDIASSILGFGSQTSHWPDIAVDFGGTVTELTLDGMTDIGEVVTELEGTGLTVTLDADSASIILNGGTTDFSIGGAETLGNTSLAAYTLGILGTAMLDDASDYVINGTAIHGQSAGDRFFIVEGSDPNLELSITALAEDIELSAAIGTIGVSATEAEGQPFLATLSLPIRLTDPGTESADGRISIDELVDGTFDSLIEVGDKTADISGCLELSADIFADVLSGPLASLCVGLGTENDFSSLEFTTDTSGFEDALSELRNLSFEQIVAIVRSLIEELKDSDSALMNTTLPVLDRSPSEIIDFVDRILDAIDAFVFSLDLDAIDIARGSLDAAIGNLPVDIDLKADLYTAIDAFDAVLANRDWNADGLIDDDDDNDGRRGPRFIAAIGDMLREIELYLGAEIGTIVEGDTYNYEMVQAYLSLFDLIPTFDTFADRLEAAVEAQLGDFPGITFDVELDVADFATDEKAIVVGIEISQDDAIDTSFEPEMPTGDLGPIALDTDANFALHGGGAVSLALAFKLDELTGDSSSETGVYLIVADNVGGYTPTGVEFNLGFDGDFTGDVSIGALDLVTAEADISLLSTTATNNPGVDDSETTENRASITIDFDDGSHSISNDIGAVPFSGVFSALDVTTDGVIEGSMDVSILGPAVEFITLEVDIADPLNPTITVNQDVLADLLENIEFDLRTIVAGISALLDLLEAGLTSDIISSLPLIGNGLDLAGGFLGDLNAKLVDPFEAFLAEVDGSFEDLEIITSLYLWHTLGQPSAATVTGEAMAYLALPGVEDWIGYSGSFAGLGLIADFADIHVDADSDYFEIAIDIAGSDTLAEVSLDSGLGGLPISADVGVTVGMDYDMTFGIGVAAATGVYLLEPNFTAALTAELTGTEANPASFDFDLFGLRLSAEDKWEELDGSKPGKEHSGIEAALELTLFGGGSTAIGGGTYKAITAQDIADTPFPELFDLTASLDAIINLQASVAINANLPSVSVGLYATIGGSIDYVDGVVTTDFTSDFSFNGLQLDLGDFLGQYLGPAVETVNDYLEPIAPILDVLTAEIPGVSDISRASGGGAITLIDLALIEKPAAAANAKKFLNVVSTIADVVKAIDDASGDGEVILNLGDLNVGAVGEAFNEDYDTSGLADLDLDSQVAGSGNSGMASAFSTIQRDASSQSGGGLGISLDFLQPSNIFAFLMGQTATVLTWDIPRFDLGFEWGIKLRPVPAVPPLVVTIGMNAGFFVDLSVGFDTRGVQTGNFLDGFFFGDLENVTHGADIDDFGAGFGISIGAGLDVGVASAGIEGEVRIDAFANWRDLDGDGKLYLDEIASIISQDGVDCLFDWRAEISAIIRIVWEILGVDGSLDIIDVVLAEFDSEGHCPKAHIAHVAGDDDSDFSDELPHGEGTAADGTLIIHTGHFADQRGPGTTSDTSESIDITYLAPGVYRVAGMGLEQQFGGVSSIFFDGGKGADEINFYDTDGSATIPTIPIVAYGGDGKDVLPGSTQADFLYGGGGDDIITGEGGKDTIEGGDGEDIIDGGGNDDTIDGGGDTDTITGGEGGDIINGGGGDDDIQGEGGADTIDGGSGIDTIDGGPLGDIINGGAGADIIIGGTGDDVIDGDAGDDYIEGQDGGDYIDGGSGNDVIYGDSATGPQVGDDQDEIYGNDGHDAIYAGGASDWIYAGAGNDLVVGSDGGDTILGGWGNDILIAHEIGDVTTTDVHHIEGGPDDDFICGADGVDTIFGGTSETSMIRPITGGTITPLDLLEILDGEVALTNGGYDVVSCVEEHTPTLTLPTFITIGGTKFEDIDGDGLQGEDEPGLAGWTIELYDGNGDLVASTQTDADGSYGFFVEPGTYSIVEIEQATHKNLTGELSVSGFTPANDFANQPYATIEGRKWHDIDEDGYYDRAVEPGIAGILIFADYDGDGLFDEETEPYTETLADDPNTVDYEAGTYSLTGVEPGEWNIIEVLDYTSATRVDGVMMLMGALISEDIAGTDWAPTSPEDGTHVVSVSAGQVLENIDFGNVEAAEVTGGKYADENGDSVRQPRETGVWGIQVYVDENDNGTLDDDEPWVYTLPDDPTTIENEAGTFRLGSLGPGTHIISEVPTSDFEPLEVRGAPSHELTLEAAESATADFANDPDGGITDGQKYEDANKNGRRDPGEAGVSDVTIYADLNLNATRDAGEPWTVSRDYDFNRDGEIDPETEAGWYRLSGLPIGTIRIAEDTADYALVLPETETAVFEFGGVVTEAMLLGGFRGLWENTQVGDAWSIRYLTDYDAADQIASPHRSLFHAISAYTLTIGGHTFGGLINPNSTQVRVFENHPNGIDQFEVSLPVIAGPFVAILQLDDTSDSAFANDKQPRCTALHLNDFDFRHFALRDVISDGAINANITWHRCTDDSGIYVDITNDDDHVPGTDIPNGKFATITANHSSSISSGFGSSYHQYLTSAAREDILVLDTNFDDGVITGSKWSDLDRNGNWDDGEPPLAGVVIYLDQNNNGVFDVDEQSTTTNDEGKYLFSGLADGVYVIREVPPENGEQTFPRRRIIATMWEAGVFEYGLESDSNWHFIDNTFSLIGISESPVDGFLYTLSEKGFLYAYDPDTFARHNVGSVGTSVVEGDLAFDPSNGVLYVIRGNSGALRQIHLVQDESTGLPLYAGSTAVGFTSITDPSAMAFNSAGELHVMDSSGVIHWVDKVDAQVIESEEILDLTDNTRYLGMAFDPLNDDILYVAAENTLSTYDFAEMRLLGLSAYTDTHDFSGLTFFEDTAHVVLLSDNQWYAPNRDFGNFLKIPVPDGDDLIYAQAGTDEVYGDNLVNPALYISEPGADEIYGQAGKDTIYGQEEDDLLSGGLDTSAAGGVDDYVDGGLGNDTIFQEKNVDMILTPTLLTGDGNDTLVSIEHAHLVGGSAGNTLDASLFTMGAVHLEGNDGDDFLYGGSFGDTLEPGDGVDTAEGNNGNDTYIFIEGTGTITIAETMGTDTLDFSELASALVLDLSGASIAGAYGRTITGANPADFEIIIGTNLDDTLTGNAVTDNIFYPGLGSDTLDGQGGVNIYVFEPTSGSELEKVIGGTSIDLLDFSAIDLDTTVNFNGAFAAHSGRRVSLVGDVEYASTGDGNDTFVNNHLANRFFSGEGDDHFIIFDRGGSAHIVDDGGIETLDFSYTNGVTIDLDSGAANIATLAGGQSVFGNHTDFEIIYGSPSADTIDGNDLANTIYPGDGLDTINGQGGDDIYIITSLEPATIDDDSGYDTLDFSALAGPLTFDLGAGILADDTTDSISTSATDAFEIIIGTGGNDHYIFADTGTHSITDSGGTDTFDFSALTSAITADLAGNSTATNLTVTIASGTEIENLIGTDHNDSLTGNDLANHLTGGLGDDSIFGLKGADILLAEGDGATNILDGGSGDDTYEFQIAGAATDTILVEDSGRVALGLAAGGGTDTIDLSALIGVVTIDLSVTGSQPVTVTHDITLQDSANTSSDYFENIIGSSSASNTITGNAADNHFTGGDTDDTYIILPGFGTDTISESIISAFDSIDMSAIGDPIDLLIGSGNLLFTVGTDTLSAPDRIENILLGAGDDYFHFTDLGSTSAAIDGNGGVNTYDGDEADTGGVTNF